MRLYSPFTEAGQLQQEISNLRHEVQQKANRYDLPNYDNQINQINNRLDSLEYSIGELRTSIDEILRWKQENEEN